MKKLHVIIALSVVLMACKGMGNNESREAANAVADVTIGDQHKETATADTTSTAGSGAGSVTAIVEKNGEKAPAPSQLRQIIKKAHVEVECKDFKAFGARINAFTKSRGGWIEAEEETQSEYQQQNVMTIKVPVAKFDELVNGLSGMDGKLKSKRIESEDVTNAIVDTKGRLEAKKQIRARYLELLKQAKNMEDILQVQNEINSITEDIESAAYNLQNMQVQAAYSTIYLTYYQLLDGVAGSDEPGFFSRLWESLQKGGSGIVEVVIGMAALWPLWLVVGGVVFWWRRRSRLQLTASKV